MKLATKLLLLVLTVLMCVGCFASCGGDNVTTTTVTTTTPDGPQGPEGPEGPGYQNKLLDDRTYADRTCTIWHCNDPGPGRSLYITDPGISAVDRAAYNRLETIRERTGVTITAIRSTNNGANIGSPDIGYLRDLFSSDDPENIPDIVMPGGYSTSVLAGEGWFLDLSNNNPYIDLSMECWQKSVNDGLSICGTYYGISGLSNTNNIAWTFCTYVDKDALATINLDELSGTAAADFEDADTLYEWARNGEWTYKKMMALAAAFAGEEGSVQIPGQETEGDRYGFEFQGTSSYGIFMSTGKKYVTGNPDNYNIPALMTDDPDTMKVLDWLVDNVSQKPYVHNWGGGDGGTGKQFFGLSHNVLFRMHVVRAVPEYSALGAEDGSTGTFNFGILPMPKFDYEDHTQEEYYCAHNAWFSTLSCIPENCADTNFSSFVLQLVTEMGYYAWADDVTTIWDAYVLDGLQGRYAPDVQDEEMLDLILHSVASDMGEFNVWANVNIANSIRSLFNTGAKGWATWTQTNRGTINVAIQEMLVAMGLISYE